MAVLKNRAKMSTSTTGTGTITLGSAEDGYQTFADAGVANADVVRYVIEDGNNFEIGTGTYTATGTTLSRTVSESSNSNNAINLSGSATVFIGATAEDILSDVVDDTTPQLGGNLDVQTREITTSTTNGNVKLTPNGTGVVEVKGAGGNDGTLQLNCSDNSHGVKIKSPPHSAAASYTLTLPDDDGAASEFLQTDGSGNLSWAAGGGGDPDLYRDNASGATTPSATGTNAVAIGSSSVANSSAAIALGDSALAYSSDTLVLQKGRASGTQATSIAVHNNSSLYGSNHLGAVSIGSHAKSTQDYSFALGWYSQANANYAMAFGRGANAGHISSVAIGHNAATTSANQIALGSTSDTVKISGTYTLPTSDGTNGQVLTTNGSGAVTFADAGGGGGSPDLFADNDVSATAPTASGDNSVAIGDDAQATSTNSIAIGSTYNGSGARATTGAGAVAIGGSRATGAEAFAANIGSNSSSGATGTSSIAMGFGANATATEAVSIGKNTTASATNAIAMGKSASASRSNSIAIGFNAEAGSGNNTTAIGGSYARALAYLSTAIGGSSNRASGNYSFVGGGADITVTGEFSRAGGYYCTTDIYGKDIWASGRFSSQGDAQTGTIVLRSDTTDATAEALTSNNSTAGTTNQIVLPNNSCYGFTGTVIARENSAQTNDFAVWEIKGGAVRGANAASTTLGSYNINKISESAGAANWSIALSADTTNGAVAITVTGEASHSIRWVATVNTTEVTY